MDILFEPASPSLPDRWHYLNATVTWAAGQNCYLGSRSYTPSTTDHRSRRTRPGSRRARPRVAPSRVGARVFPTEGRRQTDEGGSYGRHGRQEPTSSATCRIRHHLPTKGRTQLRTRKRLGHNFAEPCRGRGGIGRGARLGRCAATSDSRALADKQRTWTHPCTAAHPRDESTGPRGTRTVAPRPMGIDPVTCSVCATEQVEHSRGEPDRMLLVKPRRRHSSPGFTGRRPKPGAGICVAQVGRACAFGSGALAHGACRE